VTDQPRSTPELLKDVYEARRFVDGRPITRAIGKAIGKEAA